jgi:hypothetical protein
VRIAVNPESDDFHVRYLGNDDFIANVSICPWRRQSGFPEKTCVKSGSRLLEHLPVSRLTARIRDRSLCRRKRWPLLANVYRNALDRQMKAWKRGHECLAV